MASPTPVLPEVGSTMVPPRRNRPSALGRLDHGQGGSVLDAAARVQELELGEQLRRQVPPDAVQAHQRRVADQLEQRAGGLDRRARCR